MLVWIHYVSEIKDRKIIYYLGFIDACMDLLPE